MTTYQLNFLSKMIIDTKTGCWNWAQSLGGHGYAQTFYNHRVSLAHRVAYLIFKGPISPGLHIDHLCRNKTCVNPTHLEAVTQQVNNSRQYYPGRDMTHCKRNHLLSGQNLYITSQGSRQCRTCKHDLGMIAQRIRRARAKGLA